ncbi:hypothetical protein [Streptomyces sp. 2A115]|uniref:hypothetical protein n=1 Tax=Streptomyces sp. 2A115 TaxID=3457439 RepID=UPI003FCFBA2A
MPVRSRVRDLRVRGGDPAGRVPEPFLCVAEGDELGGGEEEAVRLGRCRKAVVYVIHVP